MGVAFCPQTLAVWQMGAFLILPCAVPCAPKSALEGPMVSCWYLRVLLGLMSTAEDGSQLAECLPRIQGALGGIQLGTVSK